MQAKPLIVVPTFNEERYVGDLLRAILADTVKGQIPVWAIDGGSTDNTRSTVADICLTEPRLSLLPNPGQIQSHALNIALRRTAKSSDVDTLIRIDAHSTYVPGFVDQLLASLEDTNADSVVVPLHSIGTNRWQKAAAMLQSSWLGHGGSSHRRGDISGWAAHGHHAAFRIDALASVGGYDVRFHANEDAELDKRLSNGGYRIFLDTAAPATYFPRDTPLLLFRQMARNGYWRARNSAFHRVPLALRQTAPTIATVCVLLSLMLALLYDARFLVPAVCYLAVVLALALLATRFRSPVHALRIAVLAVAAHVGFGLGVLEAFRRQALTQTSRRGFGGLR